MFRPPTRSHPVDARRLLPTIRGSGTGHGLGDRRLLPARPRRRQISRNNPETTLEICTSDGSRENLKLLDQGVVQFALVQLDTLHYAIEGAHDDDDVDDGHYDDDDNDLSLKNVRLATFLYSEKLHLFVRPHLYLELAVRPRAARRRGRCGPRRQGLAGPAAERSAPDGPQGAAGGRRVAGGSQELRFGASDASADMAANCLLAPTDQSLVAYFRMMPVPRPARRSESRARR